MLQRYTQQWQNNYAHPCHGIKLIKWWGMAKLIEQGLWMCKITHKIIFYLEKKIEISSQIHQPATSHRLYSITWYQVHLVKTRIEFTTLICVIVSNLFFYICVYSPFFISTFLTQIYFESLYITHSLVIHVIGEELHHITP